ncbi:hypothetical protein TNCV_4820141 [Trichonephila clavipes]|nr:hypothetical protein TNCV_4820141 [Trichonephila clavipes]
MINDYRDRRNTTGRVTSSGFNIPDVVVTPGTHRHYRFDMVGMKTRAKTVFSFLRGVGDGSVSGAMQASPGTITLHRSSSTSFLAQLMPAGGLAPPPLQLPFINSCLAADD